MADKPDEAPTRRREPGGDTAKPVSKSGQDKHPAGPHAADHLTDHKRTPGSGALPDAKEGEVDGGVG